MKAELCLQWKNVEFSVPMTEDFRKRFFKITKCRQKPIELKILKSATGCLKTGDLIAILGASGAGKTTLLAAISQRLRGNVTGEISLNGLRIDRTEMTNISSFLPQYSISVRKLTAFEHLYFMSHFKMDKATKRQEKVHKVNSLLCRVGLKDSGNTRIMYLSGGEIKRLSLAEELITNPPFVFCDEPTTGLDSFNAFSVIKTLRQLTQPGKKLCTSTSNLMGCDDDDENTIEMEILTNNSEEPISWSSSTCPSDDFRLQYPKGIICSIHQPTSEVFELFTHIILMDNGRTIYQGHTDDAYLFFSKLGFYCPRNCNPADFYLKLISTNDQEDDTKRTNIIRNNFEQELNADQQLHWDYLGQESLSQVNRARKISWFYQVYLLLARSATETRRNIREVVIGTAFFMITSITLAIMYSQVQGYNQITVQDITGAIFMVSSELVFTASYTHCYMFSSLLPILRRETGEGTYSLSAYYMAVVISLIPKLFIWSYLFLGVIYVSVSFSKGFLLYLTMSFTLSLTGVAGTAYGIFISSWFDSDKMAAEMAAPFDLLFLVFGGIYYNVNSIPLLKYLSLFYFSNEALMYDYWQDIENIQCAANVNLPCLRNGSEVLDRYSFNDEPLTMVYDYIGLIILCIVFHCIAFINVKRFVNKLGYC